MSVQAGAPPFRDRPRRWVGIALVNLATLTWATNIVMGRWLRGDLGPLTLAGSRYLVTSLGFLILLTRRPRDDRRLQGDGKWILGMAVSGVALFAPALYLGLRYSTAVNATLINSFAPLITGVLASVLIHERMARHQLVGALVGLCGVFVLMSGSSRRPFDVTAVNPGDLIFLVGASLWALYSVFGRRVMRARSALSASALSSIVGTPVLLAAAALELRHAPVQISPVVALCVLYIGLVPSLVGLLAWNEGVRRLGASGAMVYYNTLPLYGALLSAILLGEPFLLAHLLGGALIVTGGIWAARAV